MVAPVHPGHGLQVLTQAELEAYIREHAPQRARYIRENAGLRGCE
jgi:hypothetical protein